MTLTRCVRDYSTRNRINLHRRSVVCLSVCLSVRAEHRHSHVMTITTEETKSTIRRTPCDIKALSHYRHTSSNKSLNLFGTCESTLNFTFWLRP